MVAADHTVSRVLEPSRAARLVQQHALDPSLPGLAEVLTALVDAVRPEPDETLYRTELRLATYRVLVDRIMALADGANPDSGTDLLHHACDLEAGNEGWPRAHLVSAAQ